MWNEIDALGSALAALLAAVAIVLSLLVSRQVARQSEEMHRRERFDAFRELTGRILDHASAVDEFVSPFWRDRIADTADDTDRTRRLATLRDLTMLRRAIEELRLTEYVLPHQAGIRAATSSAVASLKSEASWLLGSASGAFILRLEAERHPEESTHAKTRTWRKHVLEVVELDIQNVAEPFSPWTEIGRLADTYEADGKGRLPANLRYWLPDSPPDAPWPKFANARVDQILATTRHDPDQQPDSESSQTMQELSAQDLHLCIGLFSDALNEVVGAYNTRTPRATGLRA